MTMITPSYLGETIEYSSLHACRSTLEDPTADPVHRVPDRQKKGGTGGSKTWPPIARPTHPRRALGCALLHRNFV